MSNRHLRTLAAVFAEPTPANLHWRKIEAMLTAAGATMTEGAGSRVRFRLNGEEAAFHRPHPQKETKRAAVRSVRDFLAAAGVTP